MIRSSALYSSLIISVLIVMICGAILSITYLHKQFNQVIERKERLMQNCTSAITLLLNEEFKQDTTLKLSLYETANDTVWLQKRHWGIYELAMITSRIKGDSLKKAFLLGFKNLDSLKTLFLADEDRPLNVSGKSVIRGTAYLPKSGIKAGYVEGRSYQGSRLVFGQQKESRLKAKEPDFISLRFISELIDHASNASGTVVLPGDDRISNSFFAAPLQFVCNSGNGNLSGKTISGNVIISSDSVLTVDRDTHLDQVILIAPFVKIEDHFQGTLQVFARDSISLGKQVKLHYPSALVLLKPDASNSQSRISIGKQCTIEGQLVAWEKESSLLKPLITIAENAMIRGEIYCKGYVLLDKEVEINGMVSTLRFMAKAGSTLYENYLIDVTLDRTKLSRYYLSPALLRDSLTKRKILCRLK